MKTESSPFTPREIGTLLGGEPMQIIVWTKHLNARQLVVHTTIIAMGAGIYGAAMGWWRAPQQAFYVAIKFPLIILLTTIGNGLLNALLTPLLGLNIPFRQSFLAILVSFSIAAAILGSFSPLIAFLVWTAPPLANVQSSGNTYSLILLIHVAVIALAGSAANIRLRNLLRILGGGARVANRVLFAWLLGNLFLGAQLSWIFRPFIGTPGLPLQFVRNHPLAGNFYEAVFRSFMRLLNFT